MEHWISAQSLAIVLVGVYAALVIRNAVIGRRLARNEQDFYVGGRRMGGIALGFSFFATFASTNSYVGSAGQAYVAGPAWLLFGFILVAFTYVSWRWIAPAMRLQTEALGSLTIPDYIGLRFESRFMRVMAAIIVVAASVFYMTAVFRGIGLTVDAFWQTGYPAAIGLVLVLVVIYTAAGGFISVVRTDILQGAVMIVASVMLFAVAVEAAGGVEVMMRVFEKPAPHFESKQPSIGVLAGVMMALAIKIVVEPRLLSRFYGLRDVAAARAGMITSVSGLAFVFIFLLPIGLLARQIFADGAIDPDMIVPTLVASEQWVHPAIGAFLFLALLAAAMSSIDSVLLVAATTLHRDVLRLARPAKNLGRTVLETRALTIAIGVATALVAINPPGGIIPLTAISGSLYSACLMAPILFGLFALNPSRQAATASMVVGAATLLLATFTPISDLVHPIFAATGLSVVTYLLVQAWQARTSDPERGRS